MSGPHHLPPPSVWPVALAAGVTFASAGLVTSWVLLLTGALIAALALVQWVRELLKEA